MLIGLALAAGLLRRPLLEVIAGWGGIGLALLMAVYFGVMSLLLQMAGLGLFLVWLRSLALSLGDDKRARHALDLIKTGAAIALLFVGAFAWMLLRQPVQRRGTEIDAVGFVLYLCIPGALVGMLIWMGSLAGVQFGLASRLQAGPDRPPRRPRRPRRFDRPSRPHAARRAAVEPLTPTPKAPARQGA